MVVHHIGVSNPKVTQYLEVENAYTAAITKDVEPFSGALYKEMLGRIKHRQAGFLLLAAGNQEDRIIGLHYGPSWFTG